jgi:hypothetical protein
MTHFCFRLVAGTLTGWAMASLATAEPVSAYKGNKPSPLDIAVERGMSRSLVRRLAGEPDARFGTDIWIYVDCRLNGQERTSEDTVCLGFVVERIAVLKLVPLRAIRELAATGKVIVVSMRLKALLQEPVRSP